MLYNTDCYGNATDFQLVLHSVTYLIPMRVIVITSKYVYYKYSTNSYTDPNTLKSMSFKPYIFHIDVLYVYMYID